MEERWEMFDTKHNRSKMGRLDGKTWNRGELIADNETCRGGKNAQQTLMTTEKEERKGVRSAVECRTLASEIFGTFNDGLDKGATGG